MSGLEEKHTGDGGSKPSSRAKLVNNSFILFSASEVTCSSNVGGIVL